MRVLEVLKAALVFLPVVCASEDVVEDGPFPSYSSEYEDYPLTDYQLKSDDGSDSRLKVNEYPELIEKLCGGYPRGDSTTHIGWCFSTPDVKSFCGLQTLWELVKLKDRINADDVDLTEEEKSSLLSAANQDLAQQLNNSQKLYPEKKCGKFFSDLQRSRANIDCSLGTEVVTDVFAEVNPDTGYCWEAAEKIWKRIVAAGDLTEKGCSASEVYDELISVGQIARGRYKSNWDSKIFKPYLDTMARTTESISSPKRLDYLTRISCKEGVPVTNCPQISSVVQKTACFEVTIDTIRDVESLIKPGVTAPRDLGVMLGLLNDLTKIVEELSKNKLRKLTRSSKQAVSTIETYLDIMDHAIGKSAEQVWTELPEEETKEQLQLVLVSNEEHIGALSKIMFDSERDKIYDKSLDKGAMAVEMKQLQTGNFSEPVGFEFSEAQIETIVPGYDTANKLNVYAIHYKSWAELLQKQGVKVNNSRNENKTKFFVGEGGIVSLSALTENGDKSSLNVWYKMSFKKVDLEEDVADGVTRRLCLSCEFLNTATGVWEDTGCHVQNVSEDGVSCKCNHTTNFAAFMSPVPIEIEMTESQYQAKQIVSYVGSTLSVLSLVVCLITFNIAKTSVKNDRLKAHINLAFALFVVHMTQLIADFVIKIDVACLAVAIVTHFFLLASFFWMLIEGIFLYLYVVQVFVHSTIEYLRSLYVAGWVLPALIVAISAGVGIPRDTYLDVNPTYCEESEMLYPPLYGHGSKYERCWLSAKTGMAWSFIGPAVVIILVNSLILCKVFQVLVKVSARSSNIRPFQPSTSSSKKDTSTGYLNKMYGRKEVDTRGNQRASESKGQKSKNTPEKKSEYGSTSLTNGNSGQKIGDSPSRFDARVPSQAYMHNRANAAAKASPDKDDGNGKHFLEDVRAALKGALVFLPILGIPWIFGLWASNNYAAMMIFLVINAFQGFAIFVVYCLMNGEVKRAMRRRIKTAKLRSQSGRSRASSTSSLHSLNSRFARTWRSTSDASHK